MVLSMSLSPSDKLLATVDVSGIVYIWELPSCNLKKSWSAHDLVRCMHVCVYACACMCVCVFVFVHG